MTRLDRRLAAAAAFAVPGRRFADIGTDHAFLPIWLCENEVSPGGVASDINEGPVRRASANIAAAGLSDRIAVFRTDGLSGIERFSPQDIFILGMGGELIAGIVSSSRLAADPDVRLILQPMTKAAELRAALDALGFRIDGETVVRDGRRLYQVILACYDGVVRTSSPLELELGRLNMASRGEDVILLAERLKRQFGKRRAGLLKAGLDCSREEEMLALLDGFTGRA
jgi:tRNA (adenine22-N1)-methyltransferase